SDPGSEIAGAQPLLNRSGDGLQGSIATLVSVGVVDRLEVVQVEQQERERFAVAVGSGDLPLELAAKVPSVGKASEIVGLREEFQFGTASGVVECERCDGGEVGDQFDLFVAELLPRPG